MSHAPAALSRLCSWVLREKQKPVISFANRRISTGKGYTFAGLKIVGKSAPNYWYVKNDLRLPRYACMKHKLPAMLGDDFDITLTEGENMEKAGWMVIRDSGNLKFIFEDQENTSSIIT